MKNAVKISEEKSASWIITAEALVVGAAFGVFLGSKDAHPALAITLALVAALIIRQAIVYVEQIFWVWTIGLGLGVGYFLFSIVMKESGDKGWAIFWAAVGLIGIVSIHVTSREHSQVEDTPNEIKRITK